MKIYKVVITRHNDTTHLGFMDRETLLDTINTTTKTPNIQAILITVDNVKTHQEQN